MYQTGTPAPVLGGGTTTSPKAYQPPYPIQAPTFVWVNGFEMAVNWPVPAGSNVMMMDSQSPVMYVKTVDASGRTMPIEVYDLVKREPTPGDSYITRSEVEALFEKYLGEKNRPYQKFHGKKKNSEGETTE